MRTGAGKIAEAAVYAGTKVAEAWKLVSPKLLESAQSIWRVLKTDLTPSFKAFGQNIWKFGQNVKTNLVTAIAKIPSLITKIPSLVKNSMTLFTKGIGGGLSGLVKLGTKGGAALGKLLGPLGLAFVAIDALTGIFDGGAKAAEIFGKESMKEVSLNQEYAAKSAGMITSILNGLTLGLFGLFAPKMLDSWTKNIAKFFADVPILTVLFSLIVVPLEAAWGAIKGIGLLIWEVIKGIGTAIWGIGKGLWDGIMAIIQPISDGLMDVFSAVAKIFSVDTKDGVSGLVDTFRQLGGVVGIIAGPLQWIGKVLGTIIGTLGQAVGWILKTVGGIIGFIIKSVFKVIEGFMVFLEPFADVFNAVGEALGDIGGVFVEIWKDISPIVSSIGSSISSVFGELWSAISPIFSVFNGEGKGFMDVLKNIGWLLGKTVGVLLKFVLQPILLAVKIIDGIAKVFQAIFRALRGDFSGAGTLIMSAMSGIFNAIIYPFKGIYEVVKDTVMGIFNWFYKMYMWLVGGSIVPDLVNGIISWFRKLPEKIYGILANIPALIGKALLNIGSYLGAFANDTSIVGLMISQVVNVLNYLGNTFKNFSTMMAGYGELLTGLFTFDTSKISNGFNKITTAVFDQVKNTFTFVSKFIKTAVLGWSKILYAFFTNVPGLIWSGLKGLMNINLWLDKLILNGLAWVATGIIKFFMGLPGMISTGLKTLGKAFVDLVVSIPAMMLEGLKAIGNTIYDASPDWLKKTFDGIAYIGTIFNNNIIQPMRTFGGWIAGKFDEWIMAPLKKASNDIANIGTIFNDNIIQPMKAFGGWIAGKFDEWFTVPLNNFMTFSAKKWEDFVNFCSDIYSKLAGLADTYIMAPIRDGLATIQSAFSNVITSIQDGLEDMVNFFKRLISWTGVVSAKTPEEVTKERALRDANKNQNKMSIVPEKAWTDDGSSSGGGWFEEPKVTKPNLQQNDFDISNIKFKTRKELFVEQFKEEYKDYGSSLGPVKQSEMLNEKAEGAWKEMLMQESGQKQMKLIPNNNDKKTFRILKNDSFINKKLLEPTNDTARSIELLTKEATQENSIYTHDTHVEKLLNILLDTNKVESKATENEESINSAASSLFDLPTQLFEPILNVPKMLGTVLETPGKVFNTILNNPKEAFNTIKSIVKETFNTITSVPKETFNTSVSKEAFNSKLITNLEKTKNDALMYSLTANSKANLILQEGIYSLLHNIAFKNDLTAQYPINVEPNVDDIENSYYYKQNLEHNKAKTVLNTSPMVNDVYAAIAKEKAVSEPDKTEIISSDLGEIVNESTEQNVKLEKLISLFEEVVKYLKPQVTSITQSSGGPYGNTSPNQIEHNTPNYHRNKVGLVSQGPTRGVLNLGNP